MSTYTSYKKERAFEDKVGWENIRAANEAIGKFLDFEPRIEYAVCRNQACCYSPANVDNYFTTGYSQKAECDRWLQINQRMIDEGYQTTKLVFWPQFHADWNHLMEAVRRLKEKNINCTLSTDRYATWGHVCMAITTIKP